MRTLAISDKVEFDVKLNLRDGKAVKTFKFEVEATRLDQDEVTARLAAHDNATKAFMTEVITNVRGQRLVLDDAGQPAEYSPEMLDALLGVFGVSGVVFNRYCKETGAQEKN